MNVIEEIKRINKVELENGSVNTSASWHSKYAESAWVYVGNLPLQLTEGDIICVMSQWGEVEDINLVRDENDTGKSRGFAFLKYEDARSCVLAVDNFAGTKVLNRSIRVDHVEKYRLPKHLLEKEEEVGGNEKKKRLDAGHAYEGKELENSFDINKGQDLFAAPALEPNPNSIDDHGLKNNADDDGEGKMSKEERRDAKRKRKEERDRKRMEKELRRKEREERRSRKKKRHTKGGNRHDSSRSRSFSVTSSRERRSSQYEK